MRSNKMKPKALADYRGESTRTRLLLLRMQQVFDFLNAAAEESVKSDYYDFRGTVAAGSTSDANEQIFEDCLAIARCAATYS